MSKEVIEIAAKHLGTISAYSDKYDADLLVKVPRNLNREAYGIDENNLPFVGYDVWNAYEVSAITEKGSKHKVTLSNNFIIKLLIIFIYISFI